MFRFWFSEALLPKYFFLMITLTTWRPLKSHFEIFENIFQKRLAFVLQEMLSLPAPQWGWSAPFPTTTRGWKKTMHVEKTTLNNSQHWDPGLLALLQQWMLVAIKACCLPPTVPIPTTTIQQDCVRSTFDPMEILLQLRHEPWSQH